VALYAVINPICTCLKRLCKLRKVCITSWALSCTRFITLIMHKILLLAGTRPEVIKLAPVYHMLKTWPDIDVIFCTSGQHTEVVAQALQVFSIDAECCSALQRANGSDLGSLTSELIFNLGNIFGREKPSLVIVHGDTTTALCGALAAFYQHIPIAHVEAGLRTARFENPFPEEMNRRLIAQMAHLHFAPTELACQNLLSEGLEQDTIFRTGNTIVDALYHVRKYDYDYLSSFQFFGVRHKKLIVTCHRRESWQRLPELCVAVDSLLQQHANLECLWVVHPNPEISKVVYSYFRDQSRVGVVEPLAYDIFINAIDSSDVILTDSGGIIEEATVLGKCLVILREVTERPEALALSNVCLVGYDFEKMRNKISAWLANPPQGQASKVFGQVGASETIATHIINFLGGQNE